MCNNANVKKSRPKKFRTALKPSTQELILFFILFAAFFFWSGARNEPGMARAATPSRKKCSLEISQVLEASIGRGPPNMAQMLQNDPKHADFIVSESHGDHHLSCAYKIFLNGKAYRYREEFSNTLLELKESYCDDPETKKKIQDHILQQTNHCRSPLNQPKGISSPGVLVGPSPC